MAVVKKPKYLHVDDAFIYKVKFFNCLNEKVDEQFILARCFDDAYEIACEYQIDNWSIESIVEIGYLEKIQTVILEQFERIE